MQTPDRSSPVGDDPRRPPGILLVNLGSPSSPTREGVRDFLSEFLADPSVVDLNPFLWWAIRNLIVLPLRSRRVARAYAAVWMEEGSPLIVHGRRLAASLQKELGSGWRVGLGMRYGTPSLRAGVEELAAAGCNEVLVVPLFPQYSRSTTGSIETVVQDLASSVPELPALRVAAPFYEHPAFIEALGERIRESLAQGPVDHVVLSLHGLPVRFVQAGDPYREHCERTARALASKLGLREGAWSLVYQSRFGTEAWLGPAADRFVPALASRAPRVLIALPGFVADCLETLEEIGLRLREAFLEAGGSELRVAPCLNDHPAWVRGLARIVRQQARGSALESVESPPGP